MKLDELHRIEEFSGLEWAQAVIETASLGLVVFSVILVLMVL